MFFHYIANFVHFLLFSAQNHIKRLSYVHKVTFELVPRSIRTIFVRKWLRRTCYKSVWAQEKKEIFFVPLLPWHLVTGENLISHLQFDGFAVQFDGANLEIDSNRADVALRVRVVRKTKQQTWLANSRVTNQKEFEEIVVFGTHWWHFLGILCYTCTLASWSMCWRCVLYIFHEFSGSFSRNFAR